MTEMWRWIPEWQEGDFPYPPQKETVGVVKSPGAPPDIVDDLQCRRVLSPTPNASFGYNYVKVLGSGSQGAAVLIKLVHKQSGEEVDAVVKISLVNEDFKNEIIISSLITSELLNKQICPNFMRIYDAFICNKLPNENTEGWKNLYNWMATPTFPDILRNPPFGKELGFMVIEFGAEGALNRLIKMRGDSFNSYTIKAFAFQLLFALTALHRVIKVQHRDIQPRNIVVKTAPSEAVNYIYVLNEQPYYIDYFGENMAAPYMLAPVDYGLSQVVEDESVQKLEGTVTQIYYRAPEFIFVSPSDAPLYFYRSDIFSLGVVIAEIVLGSHPFGLGSAPMIPVNSSTRNFYQRLSQLCYESMIKKLPFYKFLCIEGFTYIVYYLVQIIKALGFPTEATWPGIEKTPIRIILNDHAEELGISRTAKGQLWLKQELQNKLGADGVEILKKMLQWDPQRRALPEELLRHTFFSELIDRAKGILNEKSSRGVPPIFWRMVLPEISKSIASDPGSIYEYGKSFFFQSQPPTWLLNDINGSLRSQCICFSCLTCPTVSYTCNGCESTIYCGKRCQKNHWNEHRRTCGVVSLTSATFSTTVQNTTASVWFIDFFMPWCSHCKDFDSTLHAIAKKSTGKFNVGSVDCDAEPTIANRFNIRAYPTLCLFKSGALFDTYKPSYGARNMNNVLRWIRTNL